jgi:hypothetical protein
MPGRNRHHRLPRAPLAAVAVATLAVLPLPPIGGGGSPVPEEPPQPPPASADGIQLFAPTSFWNKPLRAKARLDRNSRPLVSELVAEVTREQVAGSGPYIQTDETSTPLYVVPREQPLRRVKLDAPKRSWDGPLRDAFAQVPLPDRARPAAGRDNHLTVWQPSTDRLWEFWRARRKVDGWHALWGGAIQDVSGSPGYYSDDSWPGARPSWGATATSLPVIGGTMRIDELRRGRIDHALAFNIPDARADLFAWPAQRSDGSGGVHLLPEGARLRLDPKLDIANLNLPPMTRMMAEAAQRYGIVLRDRTHNAIGFFGEDPTPTGSDPYRGANGFFGGETPSELLARFPWNRLQVLKMSRCTDAPCERRGAP